MQTEARVGMVEGGGKLVARPLKGSQIGAIHQLIAGGVAGAVSKTCTAPLARLTILFQVQGMHSDISTLKKASIWREASRIVREEGFRAFGRGTWSQLLIVCLTHLLAFMHLSTTKSGGLAGVTAASVTYPLDLVRTRLSAQTNVNYYRGIWHALRTISREEGIFGLYKGLGACLLGVGPNLAISFSVYHTVRSYWQLQRPDDSSVMVGLACGSLSGIASSTETDACNISGAFAVKNQVGMHLIHRIVSFGSCEATDAVGRSAGWGRVYKKGVFGTFGHILRAEGLRGLYRGILPEYYKVVPSIGIVFMTYEKLKQVLSDMDDC
ncbi:hypothetical protein OSB04_028289 [Centaurea solstitialis]|uniref:Mitochondrial carrier protein n=1 Tax=Centaurea solstitialis TaxID=347529 RepID=A0AA38SG73_9ASTR|nr:hypothetical protein OSB04_028289 [Centaurea solstitialis]